MIEKILPSTESKFRILKNVYMNPGINVTELIRKSRVSPNLAVNYVNTLVHFGDLRERVVGKGKKPHVRELEPNLRSVLGRITFVLVELEKKYEFAEKYKEFGPIFAQAEDLFEGSGAEFCLIYGSFARFSAESESDVDVMVVGKLRKGERRELSEIFVTLGREYSIQVEGVRSFLRNSGDPFHRSILRDHVLVWNETRFVEMLSRIQNSTP